MLLSKDARHMAVEFPSIYSRLEEMCNANEKIQEVNFVVVRLEEKISNKLKAVIETITQSTMEIGGKNSLVSKEFIFNNYSSSPNGLWVIIKFSTSDNAFRVHGLVRSILVISSYTFVWPYMVNDFAKLTMFSPESEIFVWIKPKKKRKTFLWKVWINADV